MTSMTAVRTICARIGLRPTRDPLDSGCRHSPGEWRIFVFETEAVLACECCGELLERRERYPDEPLDPPWQH